MSRVRLDYKEEIEFLMDFSELDGEAEQTVAFLLFSIYERDYRRYVVEDEILYEATRKCGISGEETEAILSKFDEKEYVTLDDNLIWLNYDKDNAKRKADMTLRMNKDLLKKICDSVFTDVPPDSEEE